MFKLPLKALFCRLEGSQIFESEHLSRDLGGKSIRGGSITMASQAVLFGINLVRSIILARLLTPEDFGLIGMVMVFVSFAVMFKDAGLSMATVQRAHITEAQISSLFWCNVALSLGLGLLICAMAPFVSLFYGHSELTLITIALSGSFIFSGFQIQHLALLRRHMLFGPIAVVDIVSNGIALIAAIILAINGGRYWALVVASWAHALSALLLTGYFCAWKPKRFQRGVGLKSMLTFGGHLTGISFLNFFSRNIDYILIGRFIGAEALGVYQRAYTLMMQPLNNLNGPLGAVGIPSLSRLVDDSERYRQYYIKASGLLLLITMPLAALFIVAAEEIILVLLGNQWEEAVRPFMYLSVCIITLPLGNTMGWLLISQGRTKDMMIWGVVSSLVTVLSIVIGLIWGINGVAGCYAIRSILFLLPTFWFVGRCGSISIRDLNLLLFNKLYVFVIFFIVLWIIRYIALSVFNDLAYRFVGIILIFMGFVCVLILVDPSAKVIRKKLLLNFL